MRSSHGEVPREGVGAKHARSVEQKGVGSKGTMDWLVQDMVEEKSSDHGGIAVALVDTGS